MLMKVFERYFSRNPVSRQLSFEADNAVIVIIPVFNDPDIFATLDSLCCCSVMNIKAGVLIVVNHSEVCPQEIKTRNIGLSDTLKRYVRDRQTDRLRFEVVEAFDLPAKYAGVGLARKIAMDLSAAFFYRNGRIDAPILSLDADTWVEPNYLEEVVRYFQEKSVAGVSIAYAHRLEEADMTVQAREAIMKYELYLRYYHLALEYTGHPHAYHCIGSAFAVRTLDYVAQGGMNKRQAGEDFYFLQKLIATGRYATLQSTQVYPSPRFSGRTPFGTGQAVRQIVQESGHFRVYHPQAFRDLKCFFQGISTLYKVDEAGVSGYFQQQTKDIRLFLSQMNGIAVLAEINANCASVEQFMKRFFDNFNAFRVLKYLNFVHESCYSKIDILSAANKLLAELNLPVAESLECALQIFRKLFR